MRQSQQAKKLNGKNPFSNTLGYASTMAHFLKIIYQTNSQRFQSHLNTFGKRSTHFPKACHKIIYSYRLIFTHIYISSRLWRAHGSRTVLFLSHLFFPLCQCVFFIFRPTNYSSLFALLLCMCVCECIKISPKNRNRSNAV